MTCLSTLLKYHLAVIEELGISVVMVADYELASHETVLVPESFDD